LLFTLLECTYRVQSGILYGDYIQAPPWLIWQLSGFHPHPHFTPKPPVQQITTEGKCESYFLTIYLSKNMKKKCNKKQ
jgi:hypothetical protein